MPLYNYGIKHIKEYTTNRKFITNNVFYSKVFNICKSGKWDADNVAFLQDIIHEEFNKNPQEAIKIILKYSKIEKEGFWFFYFDGPIQDVDLLTQLKDKISREEFLIASRIFSVVENSYK